MTPLPPILPEVRVPLDVPQSPVAMTSASLWVQGARPRTLGAAVAPVLVGTAAAVADGRRRDLVARSRRALVVALALQVGVNYANDYSDGVRGTDKDRKGPVRLTATGLATPGAVQARPRSCRSASPRSSGLVLSLVVNPWLLLVGRRRHRRRAGSTPAARSRTATSASAR